MYIQNCIYNIFYKNKFLTASIVYICALLSELGTSKS